MPNYSGIWTEQAVMQANGAGNWPNAPGAPTIGTATNTGAGAFDDVVPPSVRQAYGWEEAPAPPSRAPAPSRPNRSSPSNNDPLGLR